MPVNGALTASIWLFGLKEGCGFGLNLDAAAVDMKYQEIALQDAFKLFLKSRAMRCFTATTQLA